MEQNEAKRIYTKFKTGGIIYKEEIHCPMVLQQISKHTRVTSFCKEAAITERTFYRWVAQHELFRECFELARIYSREAWEAEPEENYDNESWSAKEWASRGARYFSVNKDKIRIILDPESNPWEQYQKIISDCASGDYTASEVKQIMESINVGRVAFESFKLQQEVDKMKDDLNQMSQRNGNNIIPITIAEA